MNIYKCDLCEDIYNNDFKSENPLEINHGNICSICSEDFACAYCGKVDLEMKYCKYSDQYYHDKCVPF
jgi:hypothetical protein